MDRTTVEAPIPGGGSFDAFVLPHLAEGDSSNQDIGVAEAWRVLELAGQLDESVDVAVLDGRRRLCITLTATDSDGQEVSLTLTVRLFNLI